ncbi:putative methyltransferase-like protein 24 [Clavelina lepadiformis]|uniref:putative methyltransferase-like protein 24 n=1 Tax=Clavelina lepadiformis TaxID=159417 RepID=UPI0040433758
MKSRCNSRNVAVFLSFCFAIVLVASWTKMSDETWNLPTNDDNSRNRLQTSAKMALAECQEKIKQTRKISAISSAGNGPKELPEILEPLANKELKPPGEASPEEELERIWNYMYQRQYHCTESKYLGGQPSGPFKGDGAYDLCVEKQFWPQGGDKTKCLVYSFGINNDFSFDDEMAKLGCEVHSFDPSMTLADNSVTNTGVIFHKIGISNEDNDSGFNGWKMRTLKTLIKELGHEDRHLDFLKVDTDRGDGTGFEDVVMQELLETGLYKCVRQFSFELHLPGPLTQPRLLNRCRLLYHEMRALNDGGWRLYNTTDNVRWYKAQVNQDYTQRRNKNDIVKGGGAVILWESSFVNFEVTGTCKEVLSR